MKHLLFLLLACLPALLLSQLPKADPGPKRAIPKRGELLLQLDMPSVKRLSLRPGETDLTVRGTVGLGYMIGNNWQIGGKTILGFGTSNYGDNRNHVVVVGGSLYSRHYLDFQKWYAFGELGIGGYQSRRLSGLGNPIMTELFAEARYGIGMRITPRIRIEASNAFRFTQTISNSVPGSPVRSAFHFLAPSIGLNIRLGQKR